MDAFRAIGSALLISQAAPTAAQSPVTVDIANNSDAFAIVAGGVRRGVVAVNKLQGAIALEGDALGLAGLRAYAMAFRTDGDSISERIGDVQTVSNLEAIDTARLFEAWVEQSVPVGPGQVSLRAGLLDYNAEFDAVEPAALFLNSSHGIGPDIAQSGRAGPSIFPVTSLGARIEWQPSERLTVRIAAFDGVPGDPERPRAFAAVRLRGDDGALVASELDWRGAGRTRVALGAWTYTVPIDAVDGSNATAHARGIYAHATLPLNTRWTAWLRAGIADGRVQSVAEYFGAGFVGTGVLAGRDGDTVGIALAHAVASRPLRRIDDLPVAETAIEASYRLEGGANWALQPGVQYVINPAQQPDIDNAVAVYLRLSLQFRIGG